MKQIGLPLAGLTIAFAEVIVILSSQFLEFCFLFASTLLLVSAVYLVYKFCQYKGRKETMKRVLDPSLAQQLTIEDLDAEERRLQPSKGYQTVCLVIYVLCLLLLVVMIGARLCTLGSRVAYRN